MSAAWDALETGGWWGLKVESLLRRTGLSARSFYRNFASKNDLFVRLLLTESEQAAKRIGDLLDHEPDPEVRVRMWISEMISYQTPRQLEKTRMLLRLYREIEGQFPEDARTCLGLVLTPLVTALELGRESGVFAGAAPHVAAVAVHHLCSGALLDTSSRDSGELVVEVTMAFALRALTCPTDPA
ncbi:hypothetical protein AXA44_36730 [Rhodococcus sp. SC4]|nr:hypothetical protein AXA44_36730 [Rhodococcus sp. SC4]